jgi:hypothetical protein
VYTFHTEGEKVSNGFIGAAAISKESPVTDTQDTFVCLRESPLKKRLSPWKNGAFHPEIAESFKNTNRRKNMNFLPTMSIQAKALVDKFGFNESSSRN